MSDEGISAIAAIISAIAGAAGAGTGIYSAVKGQPKIPSIPGPSKADLATTGSMRSEMFGSTTPSFKAGLAGSPVGPLPGAGSAIDKPIGGADEFASILSKMGGGGGGGEGLGG